MIAKFQPVIKWTGSKRSQSEQIVSLFPKEIDTYYEPFVGGGSVMFQLLHSDIKVNNIVCSDSNKDLIDLWNEIKTNIKNISNIYAKHYENIYKLNVDEQKEYYKFVREKFNKEKNPCDFMFLIRLAVNGLIRYNKKGEFNTSVGLNKKQKGISPNKLNEVLYNWSDKLNKNNVQFINQDYSQIYSNENDYIYLDPPYANTKGMYYGTIDYDKLWNWIKQQPCKYTLSFDGKCGKEDRTYEVPSELYNEHLYLGSGKSTFKKVRYDCVEDVQESLYIK